MAGKTKRIIKIFKNITVIILFIFFVFSSIAASGTDSKKGIIEGRIVSGETGKPLKGANVTLNDIKKTETDSSGSFIFESIPVGLYCLEVSFIGYSPVTVHDLAVTEDTIINIMVKLLVNPVVSEDIIVAGKYNRDPLRTTINSTTIKPEAITDLPGSFGDITRAISSNISLSKIDDRYNSMNVRGGSAIENGYYIDNIEISNMNHFPSQGSGNGPLGFLRADLLDNVVFHTGGFPVQYGNKLSSIMDIKMRKGSEDGFHTNGVLDLTGVSATIEDNVNNNRGSWVLSSRKGFLGDLVDFDGTFDYFDLEGHIEYDVDDKSNLSCLVLEGKGKYDISQKEAHYTGTPFHGLFDYETSLVGLNWVYKKSDKIISNTSFSYSLASWENNNAFTSNDYPLLQNDSFEKKIKLRHSSFRILKEKTSMQYGFDLEYNSLNYDYVIGEFISNQGYRGYRVKINEKESILSGGSFVSISQKLLNRITIDFGLRIDHSEYNGSTQLNPRGGFELKLNEEHIFYSLLGLYTQNLPLMMVFQVIDDRLLKSPNSFHFVLGWKTCYPGIGLFTVEFYNKQYSNMPLDVQRPQAFILDELVWNYGFMAGHRFLVSSGEAFSRGVEITGETLFSNKVSSKFGVTFFRSRYLDLKDEWRNRVGDNKLAINILLNYQPSHNWSLSMSWVFAGGIPYTPATEISSSNYKYDPDDINIGRLPDYHVLNLKVYRKFFIRDSSISLYLEILNIYNRNNISAYGDKQLPFIPIIGMEYSF